jgi:anti-sigma factor RsiW
MSCSRMEKKILGYVDGRLKEGELLEMETHLSTCAACQLRVNEFRAVNVLLDELPMIEPSAAFDVRMHARVAAEPAKQSWWAWFTPPPRVAFAASMLVLATVWVGSYSVSDPPQIDQADVPVLENYDVISSFEPLTELPQALPADEASQQNQDM